MQNRLFITTAIAGLLVSLSACTQESMTQESPQEAAQDMNKETPTASSEMNEEMVAEDKSMSFFVTSAGPGDGANLGGLSGADAHCQQLAEAAGSQGKTWKAYLSSSAENAKDRIGSGPWYNAKGMMIADNLEALHGDANGIDKETGLNEKGEQVNGRGDDPNRHDILTGSTPEGTVSEGQTCDDWTSSDSEGSAVVGHHDRMGLDETPPSKSWNSSHPSRGCSQSDLQGTGGDGLFYCFAEK